MRIMAVTYAGDSLEGLEYKIAETAPEAELAGFWRQRDALAYAKANLVDVALVDSDWPEMDGCLILAKELRELNPRVNIIFLAAMTDKAVLTFAFRNHASGYLRKPFNREELALELRNLRYAVPRKGGMDADNRICPRLA